MAVVQVVSTRNHEETDDLDVIKARGQFAIAKSDIGYQVYHLNTGLRVPQLSYRSRELLSNARIMLDALADVAEARTHAGLTVRFGMKPTKAWLLGVKSIYDIERKAYSVG